MHPEKYIYLLIISHVIDINVIGASLAPIMLLAHMVNLYT